MKKEIKSEVIILSPKAEEMSKNRPSKSDLQSNENKLMIEHAMKTVNMAWWEMDIITGNVAFGKRIAGMLGFSPDRFKHYTDFMALIHPDDYDRTMNARRRHLNGSNDKNEIEYRILTKSNGYRWFYDFSSITKRNSDNFLTIGSY